MIWETRGHDRDREHLARIARYYGEAPRPVAEAEEFGALTLFVTAAKGHDFYARPALGWSGEVTPADVDRVRARQRQLGFPECFEWVVDLCPSLGPAIAGSDGPGLAVREFPLLVLDRWPEQGPGPVPVPAPDSAARILGPDDPALADALAVPGLAFAHPGSATGPVGLAELDRAIAGSADRGIPAGLRDQMRAGRTVVAAVLDPVGGRAVSAGQHLPSGPTSQIMGIGTLPSERRHGHATTLTTLLASDARARGAETVFLFANNEHAQRIYTRLGFRHIATAALAEPAAR